MVDDFDLENIPEADSNSVIRLDRDPSFSRPSLDSDDDERNPSRFPLILLALAAISGAFFAGISTSDFVQHLDRQVHSIHCSFVPGAKELGESGCRTAMMSAYSSLFRQSIWGGLPISLLGVAVFCYLAYRSLAFVLKKPLTRRDTAFLVLACLLPVAVSAVYAAIASFKLEAVCKLCVGIYLSSGLCFFIALWAHFKAEPGRSDDGVFFNYFFWFMEGVGYVGALVALYVTFSPQTVKSRDGCGSLVQPDDPHSIVVPLTPSAGKRPRALEVLDPLCPSCKAFDERLELSGLNDKMAVAAILFPLDASCNWMVKETVHPGACAVSEAILCDKANARAILDFAFDHQEAFRAEAKDGDAALRVKLDEKFPAVKGCLGSPAVRTMVNKSLRWVVANGLPVLTPQLFVNQKRVCDEDIDLGLEFTVSTMLSVKGAVP